jgi:hypothetical protein
MKRFILAAALLALAVPALAAVSISNPVWTLEYTLDGVARKDAAASELDCNGRGIKLPEPARTRTWKCVSTRVTKRVTAPPPVPVDCVVSAWTEVAGDWSACVNGQQTRTISRARSVVTPAANGGQACPTLVGASTESRTCTVEPPPPPPPVDCRVSEWSAWTGGAWSACSNSMQTRTETRTRSIVTPASNGGAACPSLTETSTASQSCVETPPPDPTPIPDGQVITVSAGQSISAAVTQLKPGGTVVVKPGTYAAFDLKACTAAAWCTVKAETDGSVNVTGMSWGAGNWYTRIEGLKFTGSNTKSLTGSFVKFFRTSFSGGPATGNAVTLQLGTNDQTPGVSDVLLEDSWVYGPGGRYKVLVYNAQRIVLRRVVVRHDGGWKYDSQNPQGGIALYDSANVRAEDVACVDSMQGLSGFEACLYLVSNGTTSTAVSNVVVNGAIVIDSPNNGIAAEGNASGTWSVIDAAVLRSAAGGFNTNGKGNLTVTRGFADVKGVPFAAWNGSLKASACVYKGAGNSGASLSNCSSTLPAAITQANATGQGAQLTFRIGRDGTLFGEAGFEDVTAVPLWPWPNEERMKADFDAVRPAFGGRSFTGYVQGATP